MQWHTMNKV